MFCTVKKRILITIYLLTIISFFTIAAWSVEDNIDPKQNIKEHKIVRIHTLWGIKPETVIVKKGATVVWVNESHGLVKLLFTAKQVSRVCKNPVHFELRDDGFFVSDNIPEGAVASLCFIEHGKYDYIVQIKPQRKDPSVDKTVQLKGRVIIE